jgi:hypothetical protein
MEATNAGNGQYTDIWYVLGTRVFDDLDSIVMALDKRYCQLRPLFGFPKL